mgnify:CR=1 FL=1
MKVGSIGKTQGVQKGVKIDISRKENINTKSNTGVRL